MCPNRHAVRLGKNSHLVINNNVERSCVRTTGRVVILDTFRVRVDEERKSAFDVTCLYNVPRPEGRSGRHGLDGRSSGIA